MSHIELFPFSHYWWLYAAFIGFVVLVLVFDLGIVHRRAREISLKEAAAWSCFWIAISLLFNFALYQYALWKLPFDPRLTGADSQFLSKQAGLEFLTGYLIEKSLAINNIFVFVSIFTYFSIPKKYQHRILFFGIISALVFRALFIALGSFLMQYRVMPLIFGIFLILTGFKMLFSTKKPRNISESFSFRLFNRIFPMADALRGQKFFVRQNGVFAMTSLFIALVVIEASDVVFAIDSVPAIFSITKEPFIVFTSNIFAILGLRALYFLLAGVVDRFHLIKYGLASILIFAGLKMAWFNDLLGGDFPIILALSIVSTILLISIIGSLIFPSQKYRRASTVS